MVSNGTGRNSDKNDNGKVTPSVQRAHLDRFITNRAFKPLQVKNLMNLTPKKIIILKKV